MLKDFQALRDLVGAGAPKTVAVACAHDAHTLEAVLHAASEGILKYVLVGHREEILRIGRALGHEIDPAAIVDADTDEEAARLAVQLIREDKADFLQKGHQGPLPVMFRQSGPGIPRRCSPTVRSSSSSPIWICRQTL